MRQHLRLLLAASLGVTLGLGCPAAALASQPETDGILVTLDKKASDEAALLSEDGDATVGDASAAKGLEAAGLAVTGSITSVDGSVSLTAKSSDASKSDEQAAREASQVDGVASAQPNYIYRLVEPVPASTDASEASAGATTLAERLSLVPVNDTFAQVKSAITAKNQYWAYDAKLPAAWRWAKSDHKVTVAVMDSGISATHEDLAANVLDSLAFNSNAHVKNAAATSEDKLDETDVSDEKGHGTHVAGIAAGVTNNGKGISGASANANILPIKVLDDTTSRATSASFKAAYEYLFGLADSGRRSDVRVVNISLAGYAGTGMDDPALHQSIAKARSKYGILTVCAGGNGIVNDAGVREAQTQYSYPGDWDECLNVTALTTTGRNVSYSDYNKAKDLSAPGENIWSTGTGANDSYYAMSGTSMASPLVAGTAALLFAAHPEASVGDVFDALRETADPIDDPVNDRSETSGSHGALNAAAAMDQLDEEHGGVAFPDVNGNEWYAEAVGFAGRHGIMNGYASGTFGPNDVLKRAQAAQLLYNYLGNSEKCPPANKSDVSQDGSAYYQDAVNWAVHHGVMTGYAGTDEFGVNDDLTREQVARIFANLVASKDELEDADAASFLALPDHSKTSPWMTESVIWAVDSDVIQGVVTSDGTRELMPTIPCSRSNMAQILKNAILNGIL